MDFCEKSISGIKFFNVTPEDVAETGTELQSRFKMAQTVKGTQKYHRYVPISTSKLEVYKLSSQTSPPDVVPIVKDMEDEEARSSVPLEIREQNFVCCLYDGSPWIGMVNEVSEEFGDYHINFMHPHGPTKQVKWPSKTDQCWITEEDILCTVETPSLTSSSSRNYCISDNDVAKISRLYPQWTVDS